MSSASFNELLSQSLVSPWVISRSLERCPDSQDPASTGQILSAGLPIAVGRHAPGGPGNRSARVEIVGAERVCGQTLIRQRAEAGSTARRPLLHGSTAPQSHRLAAQRHTVPMLQLPNASTLQRPAAAVAGIGAGAEHAAAAAAGAEAGTTARRLARTAEN